MIFLSSGRTDAPVVFTGFPRLLESECMGTVDATGTRPQLDQYSSDGPAKHGSGTDFFLPAIFAIWLAPEPLQRYVQLPTPTLPLAAGRVAPIGRGCSMPDPLPC